MTDYATYREVLRTRPPEPYHTPADVDCRVSANVGDIDHRACDISYVQLSLLGYAAVVQHMDALSRKRFSQDRYTPGYYLHGVNLRRPRAAETASGAAQDSRLGQYQQLDLFGSVA